MQIQEKSESVKSIMWRNFLAGVMRGIGSAFGYIIIAGLLILVARKLGFFDSIQEIWNQISELTGQQTNSLSN